MTEQDPNTELGTEGGVRYGSEQMEDMVEARMARLTATGRKADREAVVSQLVNEGGIQTNYAAVDPEAALLEALPPKYRQQEESAPSQRAGRTLAESMAIASAAASAAKIGTQQRSYAHQPSTERVIELSEEEREREERIEAITSQGYTRAHAEHILEFNEREGRG